MVKSRNWIQHELLPDWDRLGGPYEHDLELHVGCLSSLAYADRSVAPEIERSETSWGSVQQLFSRLSSGKRGLWFYAGWTDAAVLHVGKVSAGDEQLFATMLNQIDDDQVDQGGDMLVGFAPLEEDWLFVVEVSPDDQRFVVSFQASNPQYLEVARNVLGL